MNPAEVLATKSFINRMNPLIPSPTQVIELKAVTWSKDSHGLFDYESKQLEIKKFRVLSPSYIYRDKEDIKIVQKSSILAEEGQKLPHLLSISSTEATGFSIDPRDLPSQAVESNNAMTADGNKNRDQAYLIVRSIKNKEGIQKGFSLEPGHVVKLGRMELRVTEARRGDSVTFADKPATFECLKPKAQRSGCNETYSCRICLGEEEEHTEVPDDLKLIKPCACRGTSQYVHLGCFKNWFTSRLSAKDIGFTKTFSWKNACCEVCQHAIPRRFIIDNQLFELFSLDTNSFSEPYIVVESTTRDNKKMGVHMSVLRVPTPEAECIKLGRGHQCDVRIGDISVSRFHAFIRYEKGEFLIYDNNSKFGTLVQLSELFPVREDKIAVQVGRTVITFTLKPLLQQSTPQISAAQYGAAALKKFGRLGGKTEQKLVSGEQMITEGSPQKSAIKAENGMLIEQQEECVVEQRENSNTYEEMNPSAMVIEDLNNSDNQVMNSEATGQLKNADGEDYEYGNLE